MRIAMFFLVLTSSSEDFLKAYAPAAGKLESAYAASHIKMRVKETQKDRLPQEWILVYTGGGSPTRKVEHHFTASNPETLKNGTLVVLFNTQYVCHLWSPRPGAAFTVQRLFAGPADDSVPRRAVYKGLYAPFSWYDLSILQLAANPEYTIVSQSLEGPPSDRRARIEFKTLFHSNLGSPELLATEMWLMPDRSWAIDHWQTKLVSANGQRAVIRRGQNTYSGDKDGVPILSRCEYVHFSTDGSELYRHEAVVEAFELGRTAPDREFTLAHYGLPDPASPSPAPAGFPWLLALSLAAFAVVGVLTWLRARGRRGEEA